MDHIFWIKYKMRSLFNFLLLPMIASAQDSSASNGTVVANCHFDPNGNGCAMGFAQSWSEANARDLAGDGNQLQSVRINILGRNSTSMNVPCEADKCGTHGTCSPETSMCVCETYYIHEVINFTNYNASASDILIVNPCYYQATSKKLIFFLSLFLGLCGFDWCWLGLSVNSSFLCMGLFKFMTMGGLGIWWIYDAVMLYFTDDSCQDGWGMHCWDDLTGSGAPIGIQTSL